MVLAYPSLGRQQPEAVDRRMKASRTRRPLQVCHKEEIPTFSVQWVWAMKIRRGVRKLVLAAAASTVTVTTINQA